MVNMTKLEKMQYLYALLLVMALLLGVAAYRDYKVVQKYNILMDEHKDLSEACKPHLLQEGEGARLSILFDYNEFGEGGKDVNH